MSVLVLIPARGGSKRLPGKNLRTVGGRTLVGHAVSCGQEFYHGRDGFVAGAVMCDTDSKEIAAVAAAWGARVPFMREPEFSGDSTTSAESVVRFIERLGDAQFDVVVLLQPTSPLRQFRDVMACWEASCGGAFPSWTVNEEGLPNGAVYVMPTKDLIAGMTFTPSNADLPGSVRRLTVAMPPERSIDINTAEDLAEAERLWRLQHG